jgi:uncharacterized protein YutE (UPF0331/DUF86 family)
MHDDVVIAKAARIERAVQRARDEYAAAQATFAADLTRQDAAILNVQRACETAIDLAQYLVRVHKLGAPSSSRDLFTLLESAQVISAALADSLKKMVGFRNLAVREYQKIDIAIVAAIIECELAHVLQFASVALRLESVLAPAIQPTG